MLWICISDKLIFADYDTIDIGVGHDNELKDSKKVSIFSSFK